MRKTKTRRLGIRSPLTWLTYRRADSYLVVVVDAAAVVRFGERGL
jgi:hypothetical protein